ncbi:unnamed protein product, partial [Closterium sp. NIES-53]
FEDFEMRWANTLMDRYKSQYRIFNDDIEVSTLASRTGGGWEGGRALKGGCECMCVGGPTPSWIATSHSIASSMMIS